MDEVDYTVCEGWYDNDLQLAAELGKTLLERNKELEALLVTSQQQIQDQALQIVYLEKQLQVLRDVTETKAKIYEELDVTSQELEKTNDNLNHELRTAQQRITSCLVYLQKFSETIEQLEAKVVDQQQQADQLRKAERGRLVEGRKQTRILETLVNFSHGGFQLRRAHSFDLGKSSLESAYEEEMTTLHMNVRNLKRLVANKEKREGRWRRRLRCY
ncbi:putative cerebellar degeneration-related protein 2-like [Apostichopus japonicus]|uniref:Putative cerebellar degeneration-related protein 2-like n=1 Tax=Stichopus japonicus TaxID=307972 RepID=A0A2G8KT70_STIJA|nr:putative cerebellar degeneration-related protein 2-like [Apostichopus japonicus]